MAAKAPKPLERGWTCQDCGRGVDDEYYWATQRTWEMAGMEHLGHGKLCVPCFEVRLHRRLRPDDFTFVAPASSRRLRARAGV